MELLPEFFVWNNFKFFHPGELPRVKIPLFRSSHFIGSIWKCWNLLFQFCNVIDFHYPVPQGFGKCIVTKVIRSLVLVLDLN